MDTLTIDLDQFHPDIDPHLSSFWSFPVSKSSLILREIKPEIQIKLKYSRIIYYVHQKNSILQKMSPQPLSGDDFKRRNVQNSDFNPIWPYFPKYGNLGSDP